MKIKSIYIFNCFFVLAFLSISCARLSAQSGSPIFLENSESLSFDQNQNADCQVLRGNVIFRHEKTRLRCDMANFYEQKNKIDAFGNIKIMQADSITIYGNVLHYDGNTKIAHLKGRVRVVSRNAVLETDSLDYNQSTESAFYYTGGKITDKSNVLTSKKGELSFKNDYTIFRENVRLDNKDFTLRSDNLKYNTKNKTAFFISPTTIVYNKETTIYTEDGWYNTTADNAQLLKNSYVKQPDGKKLKADTIFYNKKLNNSIARKHIQLIDSLQKIIICGNFGYFKQDNKYGVVRDSAYVIQYDNKDSLFLHADTLRTQAEKTFQKIRAIGNVRFFRSDLQGRCDSLVYCTADSILNMYEKPVIWSDSTQLSGEFIRVFQKNKKPDMVWVSGWALGVTQVDSTRFNQIEGKALKAHIRNNQLYKIDVEGNAITVYYPKDDDGTIIGINRAESPNLSVYMKNRKMDRIVMWPTSSGVLYPESQMPDDKRFVAKYAWHEKIRPKSKMDIFTRYGKEEKPKVKRKK